MKVLDWNKKTTYTPPNYDGSLMLAQWKAGECSVDPNAIATNTKEMSTTAIVRAMSIQELLTSELLKTTPEEVAELYLLCQDDAAKAFASYQDKLNVDLATEQARIAWVANAFFYFREKGKVQTVTVNMHTGEVVPGMEFLLKKYALTAQTQFPQVQSNVSLEECLRLATERGLSACLSDPASLNCLLVHRSTTTTHIPHVGAVQKKELCIEKTEVGTIELPAPHLVSSAIIFTPLLMYPLNSQAQQMVYDPTIGRLYTSDVNYIE